MSAPNTNSAVNGSNAETKPLVDDSTANKLQANAASLKDAVVNKTLSNVFDRILTIADASAAINAVKDHPVTQNVTNGPVAQSVKQEAAQTSNEFENLANARQTPDHKTATGQSLTHYHSFFYTLLSWEHPRATGITFAASVLFIFACRYLPVLKWALKASWMVLGVVTLAEVVAKLAVNTSVASSVRPRRYYKIPKESLETALDDLEQLINFFVIETQRIIFAENVVFTGLAFASAFISYYLIKFLPFWGLSLVSTCIVFIGPLIYKQNKEVIDTQLKNVSDVIGQQATQVKELTVEHTSKGLESVKQYTNEYSAKASELIGSARQSIPIPGATNTAPAGKTETKQPEFPSVPQTELPSAAAHSKPAIHAPTPDAPIAASVS